MAFESLRFPPSCCFDISGPAASDHAADQLPGLEMLLLVCNISPDLCQRAVDRGTEGTVNHSRVIM